ncbi:TPA: alpha/beta hydrolase [Candidatus Nomurabacteria bacterium]|nr:MAG: hypothetical protein O210_OD1C00001G0135 [Parcubacteria bacterium RAAC4_OD1_1]HCY26667.1 alpha/beta hydrolase [Candidatus Nomurabacteria bacterium]
MSNKKQIIYVGGGNAFEKKEDFYEYLKEYELDPYDKNKRWTRELPVILEDKFDYFKIEMPSKDEADYIAWKIWFEKYLKFLNDKETILMGYSQGGTFLLKYLSENLFPKRVKQIHLIAPFVKENNFEKYKLMNFKFDLSKINRINEICDDVHIWYSSDDFLVLPDNSEIVIKNIPKIVIHKFDDRNHFFQEAFPELLEVINKSIL